MTRSSSLSKLFRELSFGARQQVEISELAFEWLG